MVQAVVTTAHPVAVVARAVPAKTETTETSGLTAEVKAGQPITIAIEGK